MSSIINLNRFQTLFWCFNSKFWTSKCRLCWSEAVPASWIAKQRYIKQWMEICNRSLHKKKFKPLNYILYTHFLKSVQQSKIYFNSSNRMRYSGSSEFIYKPIQNLVQGLIWLTKIFFKLQNGIAIFSIHRK